MTVIFSEKLLPNYSIWSEVIVTDILELKSSVPEHIIPKILELQLGVRQTVLKCLPSISLNRGVLTGIESINTDPIVCPTSTPNYVILS